MKKQKQTSVKIEARLDEKTEKQELKTKSKR
jgi:hypothetical protein